MGDPSPTASAARARLLILLAAVLWSTSGAFTKILTVELPLGLHQPRLTTLQIACYRVLFAGLVLLPLLRRRDLTFRPAMLWTATCFAVMNALFITAMALGSSANAIVLQYTAPMWMTLACVWFLGEPVDRRGVVTLVIGLVGIVVIVAGGWQGGEGPVVLIALGSGLAYAGVILGLRVLRGASPVWLTVVNHLFGALVLLPFVVLLPPPSLVQFGVLFLYGAVQMALPYWLMARSLRSISPQEAGTLTLLEPILNPLWAWLATLAAARPEAPEVYTYVGGVFIVGALAYRYWPRRPIV